MSRNVSFRLWAKSGISVDDPISESRTHHAGSGQVISLPSPANFWDRTCPRQLVQIKPRGCVNRGIVVACKERFEIE